MITLKMYGLTFKTVLTYPKTVDLVENKNSIILYIVLMKILLLLISAGPMMLQSQVDFQFFLHNRDSEHFYFSPVSELSFRDLMFEPDCQDSLSLDPSFP